MQCTGNGKYLQMYLPHLIISTNYLNYLLNFNLLSAGLWERYEIVKSTGYVLGNPNKKLVPLTPKKKKKLLESKNTLIP